MRFSNCAAAVAGFAGIAAAQPVNTRLAYQVSTDGISWSSSTFANRGDLVHVRAVVSYIGTTPITGGLGQIIFQPVVSGWTPGSSIATTNAPNLPSDNPLMMVGPIGGTRSTPIGTVPDLPGQWGRITPFGANATSTSTFLRGHLGTGTASGLLRIARANITNWIGVGATSGADAANNWNGGGGVSIAQIASPNRIVTDPQYIHQQTDVPVFKFGITIGSDAVSNMTIGSPGECIGRNTTPGTTYGQQNCRWFQSVESVQANAVGSAEIIGAQIILIPAPGAGLLGLAGVLALARRRRCPG